MKLWQHFPKLSKSPRIPGPKGSVPDGERIYAIGDIHGRLDLLDAMLDLIARDGAGLGDAHVQLIVLGDVIDRGPDSAGVVERLCSLAEGGSDIRLLKGNHEEVFLKVLDGDLKALRFFCKIGGRETLISYGIPEAAYNEMSYEDLMAALLSLVPARHRDFVDRFEDTIVAGDFAFVHAGIRPDVPLDAQAPSDLRWIRSEFLDHTGDFEKVIVHGHTVTSELDVRDNRIGVDTGAYSTGRLSALVLERETWRLLQTNASA